MLPSPLRNVEAKSSAYPKKEISGHESNNEMLPSSLRNVEAKPSAYPKKEIIGDTELESKSSAPSMKLSYSLFFAVDFATFLLLSLIYFFRPC